MSKKPSIGAGVEWIALNDNEGQGDSVKAISEYISTCLLADLFGKDRVLIAEDIARYRRDRGLWVGD